MRLTTIGTGTAAPSPTRVQSAALIESGTSRVLVDCGSGAVYRMAQLGIDWRTITHVLLTHFHADHTNDLANLLYAWRYGTLPPRTEPVALLGPPGTDALVDALAGAFGASLRETVPLNVREVLAGERVDLGDDLSAEALKVPHTEESVAYSFTGGTRRVVISGDTGYDETLAKWAGHCDVLVLECSLPDELAIASHLTPRQCGALAAIAQPKQLVLTHFYPPVELTDIRNEVAERFGGAPTLAHDGWTVDLEETECLS